MATEDQNTGAVTGVNAGTPNTDSKPTVLVVEDNEWVQDYVKKIFDGEFDVVVASDGVLAMEALADLTPDLIILDIMMPRMDGNEVFDQLKADPRLSNVPVIMFTAIASEENRLEGLERGADDYIGKPFNPRELLARTRNLIQLRRQEKELKQLNGQLEERVRKQVALIVSERKRYEDELIKAKDKSEASDKVKTFILKNMSHEIRTPITNILGFAEILKDRVSDEERPFMEYIEGNSKRLLDTVTTILDFSHLTTNSFELHFAKVSLNEIVEDAVKRFSEAVERKGLDITWRNRDEDANHEVVTDRTAIDSILNHLIGNAIKFTNEGSITIDAGIHTERLYVRVKDTGVGISEEFQAHMFEPFRQESVGEGRSFEGTGLGLSIAQRLARLMGGVVQGSSTKGEGSAFTVILPDIRALKKNASQEKTERAPRPSATSERSASAGEQKKPASSEVNTTAEDTGQ